MRKLALTFCLLVLAAAARPDVAGADDPKLPPLRPAWNVHLFPTTEGAQARSVAAQSLPTVTPNLDYHGGPVQLSVKAFLIFWDPNNQMSASYKSLISRYFRDIGGSSFYNITTQYYQWDWSNWLRQQPMTNQSTLHGTWIDKTPYPHAGTAADPLTDWDIQASVARAMDENWVRGHESTMFFVFTAPGIESCFFFVFCTPGTQYSTYCAYHAFFFHDWQPVVYANMPYGETWGTACRAFSTSPNGDMAADAEISTASHEHFEAATDPLLLGWWDPTLQEVADKCGYNYGSRAPDGSNLTLGGHPYIIQLEWSNEAHACVKSR